MVAPVLPTATFPEQMNERTRRIQAKIAMLTNRYNVDIYIFLYLCYLTSDVPSCVAKTAAPKGTGVPMGDFD